jgi:hypothetical protein
MISITISWSRVLLEKLTVIQLVKKFTAFYGTKCSLLFSHEPITGSCPDPDESSPQLPTLFLSEINSNIILPSTPRSSEWSLPFKLSEKSFVYVSHLS